MYYVNRNQALNSSLSDFNTRVNNEKFKRRKSHNRMYDIAHNDIIRFQLVCPESKAINHVNVEYLKEHDPDMTITAYQLGLFNHYSY